MYVQLFTTVNFDIVQQVGRYETIAEQDAREINKKDLKFSSILLNHLVDADATQKRYTEMKETEVRLCVALVLVLTASQTAF